MSASAIRAGRAYVEVAVANTQQASSKLTDMVNKLNGMFGGAGKIAAGNIIADSIIGALKQVAAQIKLVVSSTVSELVDAMLRLSDVVKQADRLGVGIGWMSKMRVVAKDSNMSLNEMEQSFAAFQRNIETAGQGVGESKITMERLGLDPKELASMGLEQAILKVTEALGSIPDTSARAGAAMRIFGEQGRKLLPILAGNTELFKSLIEQGDFLGLSVDENGARAVDDLRDSWKKFGMQVDAIWEKIVTNVAPAFSMLLDQYIIPGVHVFSQLVGVIDDGGLSADLMSVAFNAVSYAIKQATLTFIEFAEQSIRSSAKVIDSIANIIEFVRIANSEMLRLSGMSWFVGDPLRESMDFTVDKMRAYAEAFNKTANELDSFTNTFDERFRAAQEEWAELLKREREGLRNNIEPLEEAVADLSNLFKGDALGRSASTMQKIQEWHLQNAKDIKDYVKKIAGMLGTAPVVRMAP